MTTPDERKRAVDRLLAAPIGTNALASDLRLLLSERAELLAAVERMQGALEFYADEDNWFGVYMVGRGPMGEDWSQDGNPDWPDGKPGRCAREILGWTVAEIEARAVLTTGEEK
tara:strand:- start:2596 stop:2937 length:342 start_codon:yes stop_codon:yes gene_type:complete